MSMLPRLKPRTYYDLVIEVAIVRPGPIEGGMVHPYLKNRALPPEAIKYPKEDLREALGRTCGVPIFQEQVMQVAMIAAGFSAGEADGLRRAMAAWKRPGVLEKYYDKVIKGMRERGYEDAFAERIFSQIKGFSSYGFPESHAASFALLTYVSSWLKCHEPAAFLCALLNSQPLGFYTPSQLVQDARRHDIEVRAIDVNHSNKDSTLELRPGQHPPARGAGDGTAADQAREQPAVRLGLRLVASSKPATATAPSPTRKTWPCAPASRSRTCSSSPPPTPSRHLPATAASRSGRPRPCMPCRRCCKAACCPRTTSNCPPPPRARKCCGTTPPPASRCAATRWRCCARAWPSKAC
jgi:DNA polymerase III alpha subunit